MKKFYFLLLCVSLLLSQGMSAKDIYLSASGNDGNNGLSAASAVKTLMRVNDIVEMEDIIHVSGIIKITDEVDFAKKTEDGTQDPLNPEKGIYLYHRGYFFRNALKLAGITFLGEDSSKDGFSGEKQSALFQFQGANPVTFKNILFTKAVTHRAANGQYGSDASAIWAAGTELTFENCSFTLNDISRNPTSPADPKDGWGNRGAVTINNSKATFKGCNFSENTGQEGGALFLSAGDITIENCYFGYNNCAEVNGSKGGVICTWVHGADGPLNITISKSVFEGNTAKKGGAIAMVDKVSYQPTSTTMKIDRCTFIGNQATQDQGGAILLDNFMGRKSRDTLMISNTLLYGNSANYDGGSICIWNVQPNSELSMINCTMNGNFTNGNAGNGGGLAFMTGYETYLPINLKKNIHNCIFDGNYATEGGSTQKYADLTALYAVKDQPDNFEMTNSYVGRTINMAGKAGISTESNKLDYYEEGAYDAGATAGLNDADYYAANFHAIPLSVNANTRTYGDARYLVGTRDLSGKKWVVTAGKSAIGASEVTSKELDDNVKFGDDETGIIIPQGTDSHIKLISDNNVLRCSTDLEGTAVFELYGFAGNKIAFGNDSLSLRGIPSGIYIVKVQIGTSVLKQKLMVVK